MDLYELTPTEENGSALIVYTCYWERVWQEQGHADSDAFEKDDSLQRKMRKCII